MIVIAKNTESKFIKKLQSSVDEHLENYCFHVEFSKVPALPDNFLEQFLYLLNDLPHAYLAHVFICKDSDIFIIMQGFMQRHFNDFLKSLTKEIDIADLSNFSRSYEIQLEHQYLEDLALEKFNKLEKATHAAGFSNLTPATQFPPDTNTIMVENLPDRRKNRPYPLIMIADDDQLCRTLAANVIRGDFKTCLTKNGIETLNRYIDEAPDVLFLDIGLPDMNGHDVLKQVFEIDPDTYVIMFSGRKDKHNILKALEAGAQGFVGKPFTEEKLFQYIERSPFLASKVSATSSSSQAIL